MEDSFTSFEGILFISGDFLLPVFLESYCTSKIETCGRWLFAAVGFFSVLFSFMTLILSWLANDFQITSIAFFVVFNFLFFCNVGWFSSARAFYEINVVVIENFCKFFFFSYYFILFSQHNFRIFKKAFVRNGLINFQVSISLDTVFVTLLKHTLIAFWLRDIYIFISLFSIYCLLLFSGIPILFIL